MEKVAILLLDVWREACRHIEIRDSAARIAPILLKRLPLDALLVQRLDPSDGTLETVAEARGGEGKELHGSRQHLSSEVMESLIRWCHERKVRRCPAREIHRVWPGILSPEVRGQVLMMALFHLGEPVGLLILVNAAPRQFQPEHESILEALCEPFEAALANDLQVRELERLRSAVEADKRTLLRRLGRKELADVVVGAESGLRTVMERAEMVARSDAPVLLLGETGTGKEVVAREIHRNSPRAEGPFLRVNCGAISPELIDSELFGHEVGSFTGATTQRKGWFERADSGTLMLDEVADLPPAAQVRLLRVLQDGSFERVGGQQTIHVNVRIVAATHRDLPAMIANGRFREDLWYRLAVFPIQLPALRERVADIPAMANHFALRAAHRFGLSPQLPTPEDLQLLTTYDWPGNVRELASVMDRAAILGDGHGLQVARALGLHAAPRPAPSPVAASHLGPNSSNTTATHSGVETIDDAMRRHIEAALQKTCGRIQGPFGAARILNINANTLRGRMRKLGIDRRKFREFLKRSDA